MSCDDDTGQTMADAINDYLKNLKDILPFSDIWAEALNQAQRHNETRENLRANLETNGFEGFAADALSWAASLGPYGTMLSLAQFGASAKSIIDNQPEDTFGDESNCDDPTDGTEQSLPSEAPPPAARSMPLSDPSGTPIILDIGGDGIDLISLASSSTYFDLDEDGFAERVGWVSGADALLAFDGNGDGNINDASELFGGASGNGFEDLESFDTNFDGQVDASDALFSDLLLWFDLNGNGVAEEGELSTLSEHNVFSISLDSRNIREINEGHDVSLRSSYTTTNGQEFNVDDVWFNVDQFDSKIIVDETASFSRDLLFLPNIRGYGDLANLSYTIGLNSDLAASARSLTAEVASGDIRSFLTNFETFLFAWAGVENIEANSRGFAIDSQRLAFLEVLNGSSFDQGDYYGSYPGPVAGLELDRYFTSVLESMAARFIIQSVQADANMEFFFGEGNVHDKTLKLIDDYFFGDLSELRRIDYDISNDLLLVKNSVFSEIVKSVFESEADIEHQDASLLISLFRHDFGSTEEHFGYFEATVLQGLTDAGIQHAAAAEIIIELTERDGRDIFGTSGNDVLVGTLGNDVLIGGAGNDVYVWGSGQGNDVTDEEGFSFDILRLNGLNPEDVEFFRTNPGVEDVYIRIKETGEFIILDDFNAREAIEEIHFQDGTIWNHETVLDMAPFKMTLVSGTQENDDLQGTRSGDIIEGLLGDDALSGGRGDDTYVYRFGDGNDVIDDNGSSLDNDTLRLQGIDSTAVSIVHDRSSVTLMLTGSGENITLVNSLINPRDGVENILFDDLTLWTMADLRSRILTELSTDGDDNIVGFDGTDDTLTGGIGNDFLSGDDGSDIYIFSLGDGQDIIEDNGFNDTDQLRIQNFDPASISLVRSQNSVTLVLGATGDQVTLKNSLDSSYDEVEQVIFDDGTLWTMADLRSRILTELSTDGDDNIVGFDGTDDTLTGGLGNDFMSGDDGSDIYIFSLGDGQDIIEDNGFRDTDQLRIQNFDPASISLVRSQNSVTLVLGSTGDQVTLKNSLDSSYDEVEQVIFDDGTLWTMADLRSRILTELSTDGDDNIVGFDGTDDTLTGGLGNDFMSGDDGSDIYIFSLGDGQDIIEDNGFRDTDQLRIQNFDPASISVVRSQNNVTLVLGATGDQVTLKNSLDSSYDEVEQVIFDDGTLWTMADLRSRILSELSTDGDDSIVGFDGFDDTLRGGLGNDSLYGENGNDTLIGGTGADRLDGGRGNDTIDGGAGVDLMFGGFGDDTFILSDTLDEIVENAGEGTDTVYAFAAYTLADNIEVGVSLIEHSSVSMSGNSLDNTLILSSQAAGNAVDGGGGNDTIYVQSNTVVVGGTGNDVLVLLGNGNFAAGGAGDDTYILSGTNTNIAEYESGGTDTIYSYRANTTLGSNIEILVLISFDAAATLNGTGNSVDNTIIGTAGSNTLAGLDGSDFLIGGGGNDFLIGGLGLDVMQGNVGNDIFFYNSTAEAGDVIQDWIAADDSFMFGAASFGMTARQSLTDGLNFISDINPFSVAHQATFLWDSDDTALYFDADGTGATAAILVADLQGFTDVGIADFTFI